MIDGGRRILSNVVASQTALHAASGGIVPEVAARAHLRWIVPVLDEALADAGVSVRRRRRGRGHPRSGPCRLAPRRDQLREDARLGPRQAPRRGQPPRGPPVRGVAARSGRGGRRDEPVFPLVALIVSGGHTFLVEMRDHLTYRLLGQTVDDAAGEAFDKVGRLLGLPYPGGPAVSRAAEAATPPRRRVPAGVARRHYDFSFCGLKTAARRTIDEARADEGLPTGQAAAAEPDARLSDGATAELAWGFQDAVVDVLVDEDDPGGRGDRRPLDRARRRGRRERRAASPARRRGRGARAAADRAAAGALHGQRGDDRRGRGAPVRGRRAGRPRPRREPVAAAGPPMTRPGGCAVRPSSADRPGRGPPHAARTPASGRATALSQNFLADPEVLEAILAEAAPAPGGRVLEIGPGLGLLTGGLLEAGAL